MNKIILNFDKSTTTLAGEQFGYETYKEQVESQIKENEKNIIIFPTNINDISASFIEGMYEDIKIKYRASDVLEIMILHTENLETNNKIKEVIETYII